MRSPQGKHVHKLCSGGKACLSELQRDVLQRWDRRGDGSGKSGLAAVVQKTDVAKWPGVEGRSPWSCAALPPGGLKTNLVEMVARHDCTSTRSSLTRLSRPLVLTALLQVVGHFDLPQILNVLHAGFLLKSHEGTAELREKSCGRFQVVFWFTCDSEKHSSSELRNPSGASIRMSRLPASSSSSLQGHNEKTEVKP